MGSGPSPAAAAASPASIKQRLSSTGSHAPEHRSLESLDDRPRVVGDITGDGVDCSLVFPPAAARAATLLVQVFAHLPDQRAIIEREARRLDGTATRRATRRLRVAISRGDALQVELQARGLEIDERVQELVWTGQPESVQFGVRVPDSHPGGNVIVTAIVSRDGLPLGALKGVLNVGSTANAVEAEEVGIARRFRRAFVSYATKDRDQVLRRVQMLHSLDIDYFQDLLSLSPGERWERELYRQIDRCDLFLLFWSTAAKQSDWVMQEVQYALDRKRGDDDALPEIRPVILEGPPVPTPPAELAHLQFNDLLVYLLRPSEALSDG
ncbi:MAG TPA: toll/interleukin-1 receptor domain-containing protein [Polyangiales bacterium]|nr:toll/interleukin-1 receptor domain-containing protein [Polyangiales bacterium]